jgi:hypothetical protein
MSFEFPGRPAPGSTAWAAERIRRLLDLEDQNRTRDIDRSLVVAAAPFKLREYPPGSEAWAAQQIRLMDQRSARDELLRQVAARTGWRISRSNADDDRFTAPAPVSADRPSSFDPQSMERDNRPIPLEVRQASFRPPAPSDAVGPAIVNAAAPAVAAIPWIVGELPAWLPGLAAVLGIGSLLRGDVRDYDDDEERDFCLRRWEAEYERCDRWSGFRHACRDRAADRLRLCIRNGGKPDPDEPPEWGWADIHG